MEIANIGIPIIGVGIALAVILVVFIILKNWTHAAPDELVVFYGAKKGARYLTGGGKWKIPLVEKVKRMSLAPFEIHKTTEGIFSNEFVNVNMEWVALVRFAGQEGVMQAGAERFLSLAEGAAGRGVIQQAITEILHGQVRAISAGMKVEDLNQNREQLQQNITEEIETKLTSLGFQLDAFSIQQIVDDANVLDNLGASKAATASRDARIARAEAEQTAREREAAAAQAAQEAEAAAAQAIAVAERNRDVRRAELTAETQRELARAAQSGPLAQALAEREVVKAQQEKMAEQEQGRIAVEQQRALAEVQRFQATVVVEAEAQQKAAISRAEGEAQAIERLAAAQRVQATTEAFTIGEKLRQEADGKEKLAAALNAMQEAAQTQTLVPLLIESLPAIAREFAQPYGAIDQVVVIDSGQNGHSSAMDRFAGNIPGQVAAFFKTVEAVTGVNLAAVFKGNGKEVDIKVEA